MTMPADSTDPGATVRTTDLRDGSYDEVHLEPNNYVIVCGPGVYVAHEQRFQNGTVNVTIKRTLQGDT